MHPDGSTGVLHKAGTQVAAFNVDKEGKAEIGELYLGKYFVKEITPRQAIFWMKQSMKWTAAMKATR